MDEALQAFDETLLINPANTLVHQTKGVIFSVRGEHEKNLESLRKADPKSRFFSQHSWTTQLYVVLHTDIAGE